MPISLSKMLSGALSSALPTGRQWILLTQRAFNTWVRPPGRSFADIAGGKGDFTDNLNAAAPSCWKFDQDDLMISSVSEMYPMAVIWLFWARDSFCIARWFWLPRHITKSSCTLAILCNFLSSACCFNSKSFSVSEYPCSAITNQDCVIGSSKLPYYDFSPKRLASGLRLSPADNNSQKGKPGLDSDTMW